MLGAAAAVVAELFRLMAGVTAMRGRCHEDIGARRVTATAMAALAAADLVCAISQASPGCSSAPRSGAAHSAFPGTFCGIVERRPQPAAF